MCVITDCFVDDYKNPWATACVQTMNKNLKELGGRLEDLTKG